MSQTNTKKYNESLTEEQKLDTLKNAKGSPWYDGWKPYCVQPLIPCDSRLTRMQEMPYGFRCRFCGNMVGWNLEALVESPLNAKRTNDPKE